MKYKSLLSVLTDPDTSATALRTTAALAQAWDSHAEFLCLGVDRSQVGYHYVGANAMIMQEALNQAQDEARGLLSMAKQHMSTAQIRWSAEDEISPFADLGRPVALRARFSDLVVLPKPYGKEIGAELVPVVESALFEGHAPVLVVPDDCEAPAAPKRVIVAWNESVEALAAIRAAIPLMKQAERVRITVIDPPQHGPERSDPGGRLSQMLSRHDISCEIDVLAKSLPRVSDVINRHVVDTQADLVVMGAYGHSRFREAILGGATRNMLEQAQVPVLLAH
ncbi:MAG: universal stress protein [Marinibacterium sp.]|nr:universal stress protein [Marinibacterium sp.]